VNGKEDKRKGWCDGHRSLLPPPEPSTARVMVAAGQAHAEVVVAGRLRSPPCQDLQLSFW